MTDFQLLIDLHKMGSRQGPGSDAVTERALDLALTDRSAPLKVADIGCGTGASTLVLASRLNAEITAVDFLPEFLDELEARAKAAGLSEKITTLAASMEGLPFAAETYDLIWSEGAIYNMGFECGVNAWHHFLKPGGLLVVSEITWITGARPEAIQNYWQGEYAEIDTASAKMAVLERNGYSPVAYFVLPEYCWLDNYYQPLQDRFASFLQRHANCDAARRIVAAEQREIELYAQYKSYYSYGVYLARKLT